jgi:hypothetical protein
LSIISTVWAGSARPPRSAYARKWLAARLVGDEQRKRPPITLAGRRPAVVEPVLPPSPIPRGGWGPDLNCDGKGNRTSVPGPSDGEGPYARWELLPRDGSCCG